MKLQLSTEFALHGLLYLAARRSTHPAQLPEIAAAIKVKESYLRKLFQQMVHRGLLRAFKGNHGGYVLRRPAQKISLYDVVRSIEGDADRFTCYGDRRDCSHYPDCGIHDAFDAAYDAFKEHLRKINLQQLLEADFLQRTPSWLQDDTIPAGEII